MPASVYIIDYYYYYYYFVTESYPTIDPRHPSDCLRRLDTALRICFSFCPVLFLVRHVCVWKTKLTLS